MAAKATEHIFVLSCVQHKQDLYLVYTFNSFLGLGRKPVLFCSHQGCSAFPPWNDGIVQCSHPVGLAKGIKCMWLEESMPASSTQYSSECVLYRVLYDCDSV